jgi:glycerol-3-phosphate dehydrogenase
LSIGDIESSWAGLRPLIHEEGKSSSDLSRKDEIFESPSGLISIAGGKLTGYRKMAERVVSLVIRKYFNVGTFRDCYTDNIKLSGVGFNNAKEVKEYIQQIIEKLQALRNGNTSDAHYLVYNYGRQTDDILKRLKNDPPYDADLSLALAELDFCIHHEMVLTPTDFFVRRTGMLYFNRPRMEKLLQPVLDAFKVYFKWSDAVMNAQRDSLNVVLKNA